MTGHDGEMRFSICKGQIFATLFLLLQAYEVNASTVAISATLASASPLPSSPSQLSNAACEARTINYITHRLPQQCLKSSWQDANGTTSTTAGEAKSKGYTRAAEIQAYTTNPVILYGSANRNNEEEEYTVKIEVPKESSTSITNVPSTIPSEDSSPTETSTEEDPAFGDATFISFEDWKQQNLEKVGQNLEIGERRQKQASRDRDAIHNALDSFGDEGEISLDFIGFTGQDHDESSTSGDVEPGRGNNDAQKPPAVKPRSKDAGTTCKERFNYASFDAGSTIKKANREAKSATKILSENKDSYMLNECSASNKFFIVELSDDILVDTVVLANFEFFSSQFRQFRVSVSDRYPVKLDRWVDLGTYEAQNARGIQAFLVEEPKIWARYLRIEFLTHFGKEYYCPVSLLRVHGRTMISEFRAEEEAARGEADANDEAEGSQEEAGEKLVPEAVAIVVLEEQLKGAQAALAGLKAADHENTLNLEQLNMSSDHTPDTQITPWLKADLKVWPLSPVDLQICFPSEINSSPEESPSTKVDKPSLPKNSGKVEKNLMAIPVTSDTELAEEPTVDNQIPSVPVVLPSLIDKLSKTVADMKESVKTLTSSSAAIKPESNAVPVAASNVAMKASQTNSKPSSTISISSPPTPSTQESFFKTVHKRLQFLEANSTLSLQYIESQSILLRDAFQKVEKRQIAKTSDFLASLNETVMNELRVFRQQYDQIWQSTVIELESQKERSEREILEVSRRMTLLADELIFQKRMSIVQSFLLLLCLGLVIFSGRGQRPYLELPMGNMRHMLRGTSGMTRDSYGEFSPGLSPSPSPGLDESTFLHRGMSRPDLRRANSSWEESNRHKRAKSYDSLDESDPMGRSSTLEESPPTPFSTFSKPLPDIARLSPLRRDLESDDSHNESKGSGFFDSVPLSGLTGRNFSTGVDHAPYLYDCNDSDPSDREKAEYNSRPTYARTSTVIHRSEKFLTNGNDDRSRKARSIYMTPPPEDGLSRNEHGNDAHLEAQIPDSEAERQRRLNVVRKPLPALPDEVDEDTT